MPYPLSEVDGHINAIQEWKVKLHLPAPAPDSIKLQLAGTRRNGERNTFAMKHLLKKSSKAITQEVKAERRLAHRIDNNGGNPLNPHGGGKAANPYAQTRADKYGGLALTPVAPAANTVIDLALLSVDAVVFEIAKACYQALSNQAANVFSFTNVPITFSKPCVYETTASIVGGAPAWNMVTTAPTKTITVRVAQPFPLEFEVFHKH